MLEIDGQVVAGVDDDVVDGGPGHGERGLVVGGDGLAAVAPHVGSLAGEREEQWLDGQNGGGNDFPVDVQVCCSGGGGAVVSGFDEVDARTAGPFSNRVGAVSFCSRSPSQL